MTRLPKGARRALAGLALLVAFLARLGLVVVGRPFPGEQGLVYHHRVRDLGIHQVVLCLLEGGLE